MQRTVPGRLEPEHGPVVSRYLQDLPGEQTQRQDGPVLVVINHAVRSGPDPPHHQLPHVAPPQVGPLVDDGESDPALEAVVEEELTATGEVVTVIHHDRDVLSRGGELQDLKPDDEVVFGVKVGGGGAGRSPVLAAPHWLGDGDGRRQKSPWRRPGQAWPNLRPAHCRGSLGNRVVLVVAVHLEYHRLGLDVLDEGSGDGRRDVLHVVEVQRRSFAIILQRLRGERFIMAVDKTNEYI